MDSEQTLEDDYRSHVRPGHTSPPGQSSSSAASTALGPTEALVEHRRRRLQPPDQRPLTPTYGMLSTDLPGPRSWDEKQRSRLEQNNSIRSTVDDLIEKAGPLAQEAKNLIEDDDEIDDRIRQRTRWIGRFRGELERSMPAAFGSENSDATGSHDESSVGTLTPKATQSFSIRKRTLPEQPRDDTGPTIRPEIFALIRQAGPPRQDSHSSTQDDMDAQGDLDVWMSGALPPRSEDTESSIEPPTPGATQSFSIPERTLSNKRPRDDNDQHVQVPPPTRRKSIHELGDTYRTLGDGIPQFMAGQFTYRPHAHASRPQSEHPLPSGSGGLLDDDVMLSSSDDPSDDDPLRSSSDDGRVAVPVPAAAPTFPAPAAPTGARRGRKKGKAKEVRVITYLDRFVHLKDAAGNVSVNPLGTLPTAVASHLEAKLTQFLDSEFDGACRVTKPANKRTHIDSPHCIAHNIKSRKSTVPPPSPDFGCERCASARQPCVRVERHPAHPDRAAFVFYPRKEDLIPAGMTPAHVDYWV
jgi:hypothetical protein